MHIHSCHSVYLIFPRGLPCSIFSYSRAQHAVSLYRTWIGKGENISTTSTFAKSSVDSESYSGDICLVVEIVSPRSEDVDSNEFLSKSLRHYITRSLFSYPLHLKTSKESTFSSDIIASPDGPTKKFSRLYPSLLQSIPYHVIEVLIQLS